MTEKDPLEQVNLARQPEFADILGKLRMQTEKLYKAAVQ